MNTNDEKEREAFEADVMPQLMPTGKDHPFLMRNSKGDYSHEWMQNRWEGWKAGRAALRAESEPVGYVDRYSADKLLQGVAVSGRLSKERRQEDDMAIYTAPQK